MSTELTSPNELLEYLMRAVEGDAFWASYLQPLREGAYFPYSLHVAIMVEPYHRYILDGLKTVESRFSVNRIPPYRACEKGDVILLKASGGPITGICLVTHTWFYDIGPGELDSIRRDFALALCAQDPEFWEERRQSCHASLMKIGEVRRIEPISYLKRDRRGWVILFPRTRQMSLPLF